jgi:hypothetical protein
MILNARLLWLRLIKHRIPRVISIGYAIGDEGAVILGSARFWTA